VRGRGICDRKPDKNVSNRDLITHAVVAICALTVEAIIGRMFKKDRLPAASIFGLIAVAIALLIIRRQKNEPEVRN
jgi:hypothetical protein